MNKIIKNALLEKVDYNANLIKIEEETYNGFAYVWAEKAYKSEPCYRRYKNACMQILF